MAWLRKFEQISWPHFVKVEPVGSFREISRIQKRYRADLEGEYDAVASYRLDDDDIAGPNFFRNFRLHAIPQNLGKVISLSRGVGAVYQDSEFRSARDCFVPFTAIGLAELTSADGPPQAEAWLPRPKPMPGGHKKIATRLPVVEDGRFLNWIRVFSDSQDTSFGRSNSPLDLLQRFPELDRDFLVECGFESFPIRFD